MSDTLGTYSFLPWLRLGMANNIASADMDPSVTARATMQVALELTGAPVEGDVDLTSTVTRDVELYGPGDVVGVNQSAIVKVEPRGNITNFEPNYLPYIEFYEEDFPWRYTPAAPDLALHRLRPWIILVVLREDEFSEAGINAARPLPAIELGTAVETAFPPEDQLWGWAHVHVNRDLIKSDGTTRSTDGDMAGTRLENVLKSNADHAYSRIISPRRLSPDTGYHAFLMPSFESGRLAGLGLPPDDGNAERFATQAAWANYTDRPVPGLYPFYHRWYFKTGEIGDFEYLVRLLKPRPPDPRLGRRDMDVQRPGANLPGISIPELDGVLRLGGALKVPDEALDDDEEAERLAYENWDQPFPHPFQTGLAEFINLADDYQQNGDPDPLITPPLYGRWHALQDRLLEEADGDAITPNENWLHEVNLDPRFRVAAGFGTRVLEKNQEEYMDAAWEQVGDIIAANRRIRLAQMAQVATGAWYGRTLGGVRDLSTQRALYMTAPVQRRVLSQGVNIRHQLRQSTVPSALLSPAMRRVLRPRDHVAAKLGFDSPKGPEDLVERVNNGEISAAPPRVTPEGLPTIEELAEELEKDSPLGGLPIPDELLRNPMLKWIVLGIFALIALLFLLLALWLPALIAVALGVAGYVLIERLQKAREIADAVLSEGNTPEVIDALPEFPDFELADVPPLTGTPPDLPEPVPGVSDSPEAIRFKGALKDVHTLLDVSASIGQFPQRDPIDVPAIVGSVYTGLDPKVTIPEFTYTGITFPAHIVALNFELFREAMAYPEFDIPMYEPLLALPGDNFLPNIDKIPPNTITLLETNQRFIEAYMLGLNVAMGAELLWREYPTDQRGSYFRQFWDPSGVLDRDGLSPEELREKLRDIPPIHLWSRFSELGDHDHREEPGDDEEEVVLVIRGELLKKYPNAVIYAQRARWRLTEEGEIDRFSPREFETDGTEEELIRTPLYEAKAPPDITFIGFDLTAAEAQGGTGEEGDEDPGWFFVIKERPGEPRFGLDIESAGDLVTWNDLAWPDVFDPATDDGFLQIGPGTQTLNLSAPPADANTFVVTQHPEDLQIEWRPQMNAAELAYILYQVPVLVGAHAAEMLPE